MDAADPLAHPPRAWRGKALARISLLFVVGALIAALAAAFGIARDYGYLLASISTGSAGGQYHALATRLSDRAAREHGSLMVVATAGPIENVRRLAAGRGRCTEMFALIQDGTPVLGRGAARTARPDRRNRSCCCCSAEPTAPSPTCADLSGAAIGIGPDGSGTAQLMKQLFADADLRKLDVRLSNHELPEQAQTGGRKQARPGGLRDAGERRISRRYHPQIRPGHRRAARPSWPRRALSVAQRRSIPAGRYVLVQPVPATDKPVVRLQTLRDRECRAKRADRIALLMLAAAELPNFVREFAEVDGVRLGAAARA